MVVLPLLLWRDARGWGGVATLTLFAGMNLVTQPVVTVLYLGGVVTNAGALEAAVEVAEAAMLRATVENDWRVAACLSLAANGASYGIGVWLGG